MRNALRDLFNDGPENLRRKLAVIYLGLIAVNAAAWIWALTASGASPLLLGMALLAYGFGLRHAVDADHIAAVDNVTRKLMQEGKRPVTVGLFFSLGHSTVVFLASMAIAGLALAFQQRFGAFQNIGGVIGTLVSAIFLLLIAVTNLVILITLYRSFRRMLAGEHVADEAVEALLEGRGVLARLLRPIFRLVRRSWHMYPIGFLFGLGFDTATEIGLLGISAAQAAKGMPIWSVLIFPTLFTSAMSLLDMTGGVLMLGVYGWAFVKPLRKVYYNMTVTLVSVLLALLVGGTEALALVSDRFRLQGILWDRVAVLNANLTAIGFTVCGVFGLAWAASAAVSRLRRPAHDAASGEGARLRPRASLG